MFDRKILGIKLRSKLSGLVGKQMARARLRSHYYEEFRRTHPDIRYDLSWRQNTVKIAHNESGVIIGYVRTVLGTLPARPDWRMLLAGESAKAKESYGSTLKVKPAAIITAGLDADSDFHWNFEQDPPKQEPYDVAVSHAILEHLINPYKHVCDLVSLLKPGGYLVLYTVIPGFPYHRYPVDCLRFFPDWFVEVAKRNNVTIHDRYIGEDHIVFTFRK